MASAAASYTSKLFGMEGKCVLVTGGTLGAHARLNTSAVIEVSIKSIIDVLGTGGQLIAFHVPVEHLRQNSASSTHVPERSCANAGAIVTLPKYTKAKSIYPRCRYITRLVSEVIRVDSFDVTGVGPCVCRARVRHQAITRALVTLPSTLINCTALLSMSLRHIGRRDASVLSLPT